jgi:nicotinamidase/pyrazinamidase
MSMTVKVLIGSAVLIISLIAWFYTGVITLVTPTSGNKIEKYPNPRRALLVIDLQEDSTGSTAKDSSPFKKESGKYIMSVNKIIEEASKKDYTIIYIRQEFEGTRGKLISRITSNGIDIKGQPGTEIDKRVSIISDHIYPKSISDAFSNPELEAFLVDQQVDEVYLIGIDAQYCVYYTAKGALNRGYNVNLVTDGVSMADKEKWDEVMKKYEKDGVKLITSAQL